MRSFDELYIVMEPEARGACGRLAVVRGGFSCLAPEAL